MKHVGVGLLVFLLAVSTSVNAQITNPSFEETETRTLVDCAINVFGSCSVLTRDQVYAQVWNFTKFTFNGDLSSLNVNGIVPNEADEINEFGPNSLAVWFQNGEGQGPAHFCGFNETDFFDNSQFSCLDSTVANFTGFAGFTDIENEFLEEGDSKITWHAKVCEDTPTKDHRFGATAKTYGDTSVSKSGRYRITFSLLNSSNTSQIILNESRTFTAGTEYEKKEFDLSTANVADGSFFDLRIEADPLDYSTTVTNCVQFDNFDIVDVSTGVDQNLFESYINNMTDLQPAPNNAFTGSNINLGTHTLSASRGSDGVLLYETSIEITSSCTGVPDIIIFYIDGQTIEGGNHVWNISHNGQDPSGPQVGGRHTFIFPVPNASWVGMIQLAMI